jgi:hypothetical protein
MNRKKTQRSPERIIKLYDWLWRRVNKGKSPLFCELKLSTLSERALYQLIPQMIPIHQALKSRKYRDAISVIIHSN